MKTTGEKGALSIFEGIEIMVPSIRAFRKLSFPITELAINALSLEIFIIQIFGYRGKRRHVHATLANKALCQQCH